MLKLLFCSITIMLLSINVNAQLDKEKNVHFENDKLKISSKTTVCERDGRKQKFMLLTFQNKTSSPLSFSFEREIYRNGKCTTCDNQNVDEYTFFVDLNGEETVEGMCGEFSNEQLYIFDRFVKRVPGMSNTSITNVEFKNFIFE